MDVCGLDPPAEMGHRLCFLGVDSLLTIELADALRSRLNINIDHENGDISELTYQQLEDLCKAHVTSGEPPSSVSDSSPAPQHIRPPCLGSSSFFLLLFGILHFPPFDRHLLCALQWYCGWRRPRNCLEHRHPRREMLQLSPWHRSQQSSVEP
ncbi:hypothetical protein V8C34DRAFT_280875 [Trichoderma compactum]